MSDRAVVVAKFVVKSYWNTPEQWAIVRNGIRCFTVFLDGAKFHIPVKAGLSNFVLGGLGYELTRQSRQVAALGVAKAKSMRKENRFPKELKGYVDLT